MEDHRQSADRFEPADLEKDLETRRTSALADSDGTRDHSSDGRILLSEEQALDRAKELPNDSEPIYLTYSHSDHGNPRNWPKWKKWYITCFVSMLNVLTYAPSPFEP